MIEDNQSVTEMMKMFFMNENWDVHYEADGKKGLDAFLEDPDSYDMITLDLSLPSMDGIEVGRNIRKVSQTVPIIMLTARDSESDQVLGFEMGADDYVTKPFSPITLMARIKALHRRSEAIEAQAEQTKQETIAEEKSPFEIETEHVKINTKTRDVYIDDELLNKLTPKEFDLLYQMAKHPRQVFSREQLLELIWDYSYFGDERTVDAHVKKLRQKLGKYGTKFIQTAWGIGYKFDDSGQ
jgi:DNA-binding response OmpR family regulator